MRVFLAAARTWSLPVFLACLLAGCAQAGGPGDPAVIGYQFHDGNHLGGTAPSSRQAQFNAAHGTWLWPPAENDIPG